MYLIYAPNVRAGGGLVLLQALLSGWNGEAPLAAVLDIRAQSKLDIPDGVRASWVDGSLCGRIRAEWQLVAAPQLTDCVFCFHGMPPLFAGQVKSKIAVFLQNRLVVDGSPLRDFPLRMQVRLTLERWLLRRNARYVEEFIVQGPSMARILSSVMESVRAIPTIRVMPFADAIQALNGRPPTRRFDFIYAASGEPHKNHELLVDAWELLHKEGFSPSLALTLGAADQPLWRKLQMRANRLGLNVINLGHLTRGEMLEAYRDAGALIFPSTSESFGLPLAEADMMDLPIVAGELDYVRDACVPAQSFDPRSAPSIARAVKRQLGIKEYPVRVATAETFWTALQANR